MEMLQAEFDKIDGIGGVIPEEEEEAVITTNINPHGAKGKGNTKN